MADGHKCTSCGRVDVRLYRDYGMFLRKDELFCNGCLRTTSWMVPCVTAPDGSVWGYTSCPDSDIKRWYALPDSDTSAGAPRWGRSEWTVKREPPDAA